MRVTEPYTIFARTFPSGKVIYYYQYRTPDGKRTTPKSTGCTSLSAAKRFCKDLYDKGKFEKQSTTQFSIYTENFFSKESPYYQWRKVSKKFITDNTLRRYEGLLKYQLMPYFSNTQLNCITRQSIKSWIIWASSQWADKTVNNAQTVLNLILNQAVEEEIIEHNPANNLSFRRTEKKQRDLLTIEELNKVYHSDKWHNDKLRTAFLVAVTTGMRIGEVIALTNDDIHEDYIDVNKNWVKGCGLSDGKTHTKRIVPKPKNLVLENKNSKWLFPGKNNEPANISRVHDYLWRILDDLEIDYRGRRITTHSLRNVFISYLRMENVTDAKIKAVVGHKDSSMTDWYTYWKPEMFKEVYAAQEKLFIGIVN